MKLAYVVSPAIEFKRENEGIRCVKLKNNTSISTDRENTKHSFQTE